MNVSPSREELERLQSELLGQLLRAVLPANEFYRGKYAGADLERIDSLKQLRDVHDQERVGRRPAAPPAVRQ